jgi:hypothetical protein
MPYQQCAWKITSFGSVEPDVTGYNCPSVVEGVVAVFRLTYSRITSTKSPLFCTTPSAYVSQTLGSSYLSHVTAVAT